MHRRRAFTKTELVVVIVIVFTAAVILTCAGSIGLGSLLPSLGKARNAAQQLQDSSHIRGVLQSMVLYSQNNNGQYPLPSAIDINNTTVAATGTAKDTTANIYALMLWNGLATAELLVSPAEKGNVAIYTGYELSSPVAAVSPNQALWDPAFVADFTGAVPGGASYAHSMPGGTHAPTWGYTFKGRQAVVSNRGPQVPTVTYDAAGNIGKIGANPTSIHLAAATGTLWTGNVGYNDNHVSFASDMFPTNYSHTPGKGRGDVLFYDEPDDAGGINNFLSIFTTAGNANSNFKTIWD